MALEDHAVRGLGVNVDALRFAIVCAAVLLASSATAIIGVVGFLALISPHIARRVAGSDHRALVPFCALLGAFIMLAADTAGRLLVAPGEIPAPVLMNIAVGPFFIIMIRKGDRLAH
jgi:iron complex transport system permease protein